MSLVIRSKRIRVEEDWMDYKDWEGPWFAIKSSLKSLKYSSSWGIWGKGSEMEANRST